MIELHEGDTRKLMGAMPANSVHCVVTSPPYFNMRDYGVKGQIGLEHSIEAHIRTLTQVFNLVHRVLRPDGTVFLNYGDAYYSDDRAARRDARESGSPYKAPRGSLATDSPYPGLCDGCASALSHHNGHNGAAGPESALRPALTGRRRAKQGSGPAIAAPSPRAALASTRPRSSPPPPAGCSHCANCGACLAVLGSSSRDAGLCVRNSVCSDGTFEQSQPSDHRNPGISSLDSARPYHRLKSKDLIGMPWRLALALQASGWWLRSCIVWEKPTAMPESVKDRPTVSHEYVFLLSKSRRYYYDWEAIAEPRVATRPHATVNGWDTGLGDHGTIAHNRPGPKDIARIAAGLKPSTRFGRGAGWREEKGDRKTFRGGGKYTHAESFSPNGKANVRSGNRNPDGDMRNARTVWRIPAEPTPVAHFATFPTELVRRCLAAGCPSGGTAFDPFGGYGAVALVADRQQKHAILHELNPAYIELARKRLIAECPLLCEVKVYGAAIGKRERAEHVLGGVAKVAPSTGSRDRTPGSPG